jgi:hypothetical protein
MKKMATYVIHENLVLTLEEEAMAYSTVTKYARRANFIPTKNVSSYTLAAVESSMPMMQSSRLLLNVDFRLSASSPCKLPFFDPPSSGSSLSRLAS